MHWRYKETLDADHTVCSTLQVKVFAWSPLFWQPTLLVQGDLFTNQVASSKILGAMATKMVPTWRVAAESLLE